MNFRGKLDTEARRLIQVWRSRAEQVKARKESEKTIQEANLEIFNWLRGALKPYQGLSNARLEVYDTKTVLVKEYEVRRTGNVPEYFQLSCTTHSLFTALSSEKDLMKFLRQVKRTSKYLDRLVNHKHSNHKVSKVATYAGFTVVSRTSTKYSF